MVLCYVIKGVYGYMRGDAGAGGARVVLLQGAVWERGGLARLPTARADGVPVGHGVGSIRSIDVLEPVRGAGVAVAPTRGLVVAVAVVRAREFKEHTTVSSTVVLPDDRSAALVGVS